MKDDWTVRRWICDYIDAKFGRGETINPCVVYFAWREKDVLGKWKLGDFFTLVYVVCSDLAWVGMTAEVDSEYIMLHHRSELCPKSYAQGCEHEVRQHGLIGSGKN